MMHPKGQDKYKTLSSGIRHSLFNEIYADNKPFFKELKISKKIFRYICYCYNLMVMDSVIYDGDTVPYYQLGVIECLRMHRNDMHRNNNISYFANNKENIVKLPTDYLYYFKFRFNIRGEKEDKDFKLKFHANRLRKKELVSEIRDIENSRKANVYRTIGISIPKLIV